LAANSAGAGFYATLNAAQLDQDLGGDAVAVITALTTAHQRYQQYWAPFGTDSVNGYQALKTAAGDTQASTDYGNASTAAALMEKLYQVMAGNATIAVDGGNGGNGTVTVGASGSGFNFLTFLYRVTGDQLG
jgi:hypothetical protein